MPQDLHSLPRLSDSISYLYMEHAVIEQQDASIVAIRADGRIPIPVASLTTLFLGPGTRSTHAAIRAIADNGCMAIWCGEGASRFYAMGLGETRSADNVLTQARSCINEDMHMRVVRRMYLRRFSDFKCDDMTLQQIRGLEGIRMREAYRMWSKNTGIPWKKRDYKQTKWDDADPINRAISAANSVLYGICHAAIVSLGYSPALGFVHTGKQLSFVYDVADLYKADTAIPAAFEAVKSNSSDLERQVRILARQHIRRHQVLKRIPGDLAWIFQTALDDTPPEKIDSVGALWDSGDRALQGGVNYANGYDP